jgi:hypothetical protein
MDAHLRGCTHCTVNFLTSNQSDVADLFARPRRAEEQVCIGCKHCLFIYIFLVLIDFIYAAKSVERKLDLSYCQHASSAARHVGAFSMSFVD